MSFKDFFHKKDKHKHQLSTEEQQLYKRIQLAETKYQQLMMNIVKLQEEQEQLNAMIAKHKETNRLLLAEMDDYQGYIQNMKDFALFTEEKHIQQLDGYQFESYLAELLSMIGYNTFVTNASGDQGIDIIAEKSGVKFGIQCKLYHSSVGNKAIQECFTGIKIYECDYGIVCTNNYFTPSAKEAAEKTDIELWDHDYLMGLVAQKLDKKALGHSFEPTPSSTKSSGAVTKTDDLFDQVVTFTKSVQSISISMLTQKFPIQYNRAARFIDQMAHLGIIAEGAENEPRKVRH
ncbi:restriction endonuclease [Vagococcus humatus]|uniref:FtsK gamma domain-containing protein n=1 Tax=Vagococcus humatus TaxID=1889241 RepID=A0A429Z8W8_9ENTE|nr:restriction endonuclease [Vagococcus humatus]RST90123.1 hypothetical protein C7P63_03325 [Vagococcus humatus]